MNKKAYDATGREIQYGDLVQVLHRTEYNKHPWLKPGNKLVVNSWEKRFSMIVFFKTKRSGRCLNAGLSARYVKIISRVGEY